jgi:RNA polymerase sigma-70 factor (ECF subfamily)
MTIATGAGAAGPDAFTAERPRLLGLAYRMTGGRADAEDIVQEAWLRWSRVDPAAIDNPAAWLTTVTTRLTLDRMRALQRRRETYVGPWLPEPVAVEPGPEETAELAESLTLGFLVVLDRLSRTERAVFLLADVFGESYATIADAVGKSEVACRQIASRARHKVRDAHEPVAPASDELLGGLLAAVMAGDPQQVMDLLDPEVVLLSDGGPNRHAARRPVRGPYRVARLVLNLMKRLGDIPFDMAQLNGEVALVAEHPDGPIVIQFSERNGRIARIWSVLNPEKLTDYGDPFDAC